MIHHHKKKRSCVFLTIKFRRKVEFALRTAWTTFLCLFFMIYWKWSDVAIHVSPVLSIISSTLYFGAWLMNFYKIIIATIVGGGIGIIIGYSYQLKPLQLVLFFFSSLWINKMPGWDRSSMVLGTLAMILGSVWPNLTDGEVLGRKSLVAILAIQLIPYIITGFSLLFPKPGLAIYAARSQAVVICRKLSLMTSSTVNAFKSYDYLDLHCAEFDQWLTDVRSEIAQLRQLQVFIDYEKMIFWNVTNFPAALSIFMDIAELIIQELIGLQMMVKSITYNHTQEIFVEILTPVLVEMNEEMEIAFTLIGEYFETFRPFPDALQTCKHTISKLFRNVFGEQKRARRFVSSKRRKMKSFYDVPNSKELINMHRLHKHEDPLDHKLADEEDDDKELEGENLGVPSTINIISGPDTARSSLESEAHHASRKSRDRTLTEMHGFHHYNFVEDVETGGSNRNSVSRSGVHAGKNISKDKRADHHNANNHSESFPQSPVSHTHTAATEDHTSLDHEHHDHMEEENGRNNHGKDETNFVRNSNASSSDWTDDEERMQLFDDCIQRLCRARAQLLFSFNEVRRKYIFGTLDGEKIGPYGEHSLPSQGNSPKPSNKDQQYDASKDDSVNPGETIASPPSLQPPFLSSMDNQLGSRDEFAMRQRQNRSRTSSTTSTSAAPLTPSSIKPFTLSQKYELEVKLANEIFNLDPHRHLHHQNHQEHDDETHGDEIYSDVYQKENEDEEGKYTRDDDLDGSDRLSSTFDDPALSIFTKDPKKKRFLILATREENIRLSLRNLGPRAAYMHRMSILVEYASSLKLVFKEESKPFSWQQYLWSNVVFLRDYGVSCVMFWWSLLWFVLTFVADCCTCRLKWSEKKKVILNQSKSFLESNIQSIKISSATTLGISLRIFELLPTLYQGGLWVALVMALIRQDNSASSFLTSYQRLEGTVIGAIFSVLISEIFACARHVCDERLHVPALTLWVMVCAFFREGPQHGYAAVVAAFTPMVLLLSAQGSLTSAWGRILENFIGIAIYLAIDNFIFPKRTYPAIKRLVLKGIDETRVMFSESVKAVEELIGQRVLDYMSQQAMELQERQQRHASDTLQYAVHSANDDDAPRNEDANTHGENHQIDNTEDIEHSREPLSNPPTIMLQLHLPAVVTDRLRVYSTTSTQGGGDKPPRNRNKSISFQSDTIFHHGNNHQASHMVPNVPTEEMMQLGMYGSSTDVRRRAFSCVSNTSSTVNVAAISTNTGANASAAEPLPLSQSGTDEPGIMLTDFSEDQFKILSASSPYSRAPSVNNNIHSITNTNNNANNVTNVPALSSVRSNPSTTDNQSVQNVSMKEDVLADITEEDSEIMTNMFVHCTTHLDQAEQQLRVMKVQLTQQDTLLNMVVYEPEIFHRSFPLAAYRRLHQAFVRVFRSAVALNSGSRAFAVIFKQMMRNHENVAPYLKNFTYMSKHMFIAAAKAEVALRSALDALSMVYEHRDFHAELTSLLTLRRVCDRLIQSVDEHFRTKYLRQSVDILTKFNPYFIVAWQNVFEATSDMIRDLSELGMALLIVRNAEALSFV